MVFFFREHVTWKTLLFFLLAAPLLLLRVASAEPLMAQAWRAQQGIGVPRDARRALELYRKAASDGSIEAQAYLAQALQNGALDVIDLAEAEHWQSMAKMQTQCPSTIRHPSDFLQ